MFGGYAPHPVPLQDGRVRGDSLRKHKLGSNGHGVTWFSRGLGLGLGLGSGFGWPLASSVIAEEPPCTPTRSM
jgi:hypothetical protein